MDLQDLESCIKDYQALKINPKFSLEIATTSDFGLTKKVNEQIDALWENYQKRKKIKLFDGQILSALFFDSQKIIGHYVSYKHFLAQHLEPNLKAILKIKPISVNGLSLMGENLLVAKRSLFVTEYPGFYELAPSGSLSFLVKNSSEFAYQEQLLKELEEEIGIKKDLVKAATPFVLIHDLKKDLLEICIELQIKPHSLQTTAPKEYTQILTLPKKELAFFINTHKASFVPLSLILLKIKNLI